MINVCGVQHENHGANNVVAFARIADKLRIYTISDYVLYRIM